MYNYCGKYICFLLKPLSLTISLPNFGFQCSWPLLGLETPNEIFYYIEMKWYEKLQNLINIMNLILKKETQNVCHSQFMNTWWYETSCLFNKTGIKTGKRALTFFFSLVSCLFLLMRLLNILLIILYQYSCIAITQSGLLYAVNIWSISI